MKQELITNMVQSSKDSVIYARLQIKLLEQVSRALERGKISTAFHAATHIKNLLADEEHEMPYTQHFIESLQYLVNSLQLGTCTEVIPGTVKVEFS